MKPVFYLFVSNAVMIRSNFYSGKFKQRNGKFRRTCAKKAEFRCSFFVSRTSLKKAQTLESKGYYKTWWDIFFIFVQCRKETELFNSSLNNCLFRRTKTYDSHFQSGCDEILLLTILSDCSSGSTNLDLSLSDCRWPVGEKHSTLERSTLVPMTV